jgi:hypothetical protein
MGKKAVQCRGILKRGSSTILCFRALKIIILVLGVDFIIGLGQVEKTKAYQASEFVDSHQKNLSRFSLKSSTVGHFVECRHKSVEIRTNNEK